MAAGRRGLTLRRLLKTVRVSGPRRAAASLLDAAAPPVVRRLLPQTTVSLDALIEQLETILRAWGMSAEHAAITAEHMTYADVRGIDSHGCGMLVHYHRALLAGRLNAGASIELVRESECTGLLDGGGGLGHVPARTAIDLAVAKCRATGLGAVAVRNSGHFGAAGAYAARAAAAGCLGLVTSSADLPAIVPTRAKNAMLGTNPLAFAAPADRNRPLLVDMATSTASMGKVVHAWRRGRAIPAGWAVDSEGSPVTSPKRAYRERRLTPLGGTAELGSHKGYGLALLAEVLSSILTGTPAWDDPPYPQRPVGHFFLALEPRRFRGDDAFGAELDTMLDALRATDPVDPGEPVLVPGDPEYAALAEREGSGIPLSRRVLEDLRGIAAAAEVPFVLDAPA